MAATSHEAVDEAHEERRSLVTPQILVEADADNVAAGMGRMVSVDYNDPVSTTLGWEEQKESDTVAKLPRLVTASPLNLMNGLGLHLRSVTLDTDVSYNEWAVGPDSRRGSGVGAKEKAPRLRSESSSSEDTAGSANVDWRALEKTEKSEVREEHADESTAFLLARLESENNALAIDPRFGLSRARSYTKKQGRPPSLQMIRQLVDTNAAWGGDEVASMPGTPPPMTELDFWTALVQDHQQTVQRLPNLTMNKIKGGVPPPLRGVVWVSMVGARDRDLAEDFDKLVLEPSPYENLIGKDVGRSFPNVPMFQEPGGKGQQSLGRVLKCFSLYDKEIGYCQGLGFLVGPLLMHMDDRDAFCVLVKLMESYGLRSCFLPNLAGLHLRIYQFQRYLSENMPTLAAHLASLQVEAAYLSQWFLSFFAVTCPLHLLFRIYDVIFAEGASETIMRVALSLMRRNEKQIMESREFEEVMHILLSRALWDTYEENADDLVNDFMEMTGIVNMESMQKYEAAFRNIQGGDPTTWSTVMPESTSVATRFLGRLWTSRSTGSTAGLTPVQQTHSRAGSILKRSPSKQSFSTVNSVDGHVFDSSSSTTNGTDNTTFSRDSSNEVSSLMMKSGSISIPHMSKEDRDLHSQIEDLLMAMSDLQRQQSLLMTQLQREREERSEDCRAFQGLVKRLRLPSNPAVTALTSKEERRQTLPHSLAPVMLPATASTTPTDTDFSTALSAATARLALFQASQEHVPQSPSSGQYETKQRLRDSLIRSRNQLHSEMARSASLSQQLDKQEQETTTVRESLREVQLRFQDVLAEKNRLESRVFDLQRPRAARADSIAWSEATTPVEGPGRPPFWRRDTADSRASIASSTRSNSISSIASTSTTNGLRELKLAAQSTPTPQRPGSSASVTNPPRRTASLATQKILSTPDHIPATEDEMLVELVNAKTAEALARQELEECKVKLDQLRRLLNIPPSPGIAPGKLALPQSVLDKANSHKPTPSDGTLAAMMPPQALSPARPTSPARTPTQASISAGGGSFWSWGKRSASVASTAEKS